MKLIDFKDQSFGRLNVVKQVSGRRNRKTLWLCQCDCGNKHIVPSTYLTSGNTKSCGCLKRSVGGDRARTHGASRTPLYYVFRGMHDRCANPKHKGFKNYGGRGISVCGEWQEFAPFREWAMASGYQEHLTIDRIDNDGNYEPSNCQWLTRSENSIKRHKTTGWSRPEQGATP